jgi:hypothetical protein
MPSLALIRNFAEIENTGNSFSRSGEGIEKCQSREEKWRDTKRALGAKKSISQRGWAKKQFVGAADNVRMGNHKRLTIT